MKGNREESEQRGRGTERKRKIVMLTSEQIHTGRLILVNAQHPYREKEDQTKLEPIFQGESDILLNECACKSLIQLLNTVNGQNEIAAVSGWRSMWEQKAIYEQSVRENGGEFTRKYVALPGHSEHQTGLAIDLGVRREVIDFIRSYFPDTGICRAFRQQAASSGWIRRYPKGKEHITGIAEEPWHFRYVGAPHAEIMRKRGMTLEEYIVFLKQFPYGKRAFPVSDRKQDVSVSYLRAESRGKTPFLLPEHTAYKISGNNVDGYIITEWRNRDE